MKYLKGNDLKKDTTKKNIELALLISLVVLSIFIIISLLLINLEKNTQYPTYTEEDLEIIDDQLDSYLSDKVTPKGLSRLYGRYKGYNDLNDLYRNLYKFVNYLPELVDKVDFEDEESIKSYYLVYSSIIKGYLGCESEDEFINLITYLNDIGYNGQQFIDCKLNAETIKDTSSYFTVVMTFNFEGLEGKMNLKVSFANDSNRFPMVKYSVTE